jgi:phenylacetate-CoA ligase
MRELHGLSQEFENVSRAPFGKHDVRKRAEALAAAMGDRERWSRERLLELQQSRLRQLVQHAVANSPYYRDVIGDVGDGAVDLHQLPVLTKTTLMAEFDRIVTDRRLRLVDAEEHLASERAGEPMFGEYRIVGSGGTTGKRGIVIYDQPAWDIAVASLLHMLTAQGVSHEARVLGIGAPTPLHMTNRLFAELRAGRSGAPRLSVTTPVPELIEALNAYQPEVLITYPSIIRRLAEVQREGRLRIAPRQFSSVAETLTQDVRDLARDTWDARVLNVYGSTEANLIGFEYPWSTGVYVLDDQLVFEVVDEHNRLVPAGIPGHKVLVTNLFNRTLPFIRYEMSDLVTIADESSAGGPPRLRLASIQGRREDVLSLPARDGGRVGVHALLLGETLLLIPEVRQYQLSPHAGGLHVRVVLREGTSKAAVLPSVRRAIETELDRLGATVDRLAVDAVDEIKRVGGGAKEKLVSAT